MLPIFKIGEKFEEGQIGGSQIEKTPHEKAEGAEVYTYEYPQGNILFTVRDGTLHEVIYQTPKLMPWSKKKKNRHLFSSYCSDSGWNEILDNGFGKTYRSNNGEMYALWSYAMDYNTFGTMEFHDAKW